MADTVTSRIRTKIQNVAKVRDLPKHKPMLIVESDQ